MTSTNPFCWSCKKRARTDKQEHRHGEQRRGVFKREVDPMKWLNVVEFSSFLRSSRHFSKAMEAGKRCDAALPSGSESEEVRDDTADPVRRSIHRNLAILDSVTMLLERRTFHAEMAIDSLEAVTLQSDASPVVGAELQGMIVEFIHKDGSIRRVTVPGSTLSYGHFDMVHKGVVLVWVSGSFAAPSCVTYTMCFKGAGSMH